MGVIEDARKGANKDAALGYGKAVETAIATQMIKCPNMTIGTTEGEEQGKIKKLFTKKYWKVS